MEYGIGSLSKLPDVLKQLGVTRPFIVTSTSLATKTDVIEQVKRTVEGGEDHKAQVAQVFYEIGQHAPIAGIRKGVDILLSSDADGIIAVGGGSPIDSGKAIVGEYKKKTGKLLRLVSIPTTLSVAETTIVTGYTSASHYTAIHVKIAQRP